MTKRAGSYLGVGLPDFGERILEPLVRCDPLLLVKLGNLESAGVWLSWFEKFRERVQRDGAGNQHTRSEHMGFAKLLGGGDTSPRGHTLQRVRTHGPVHNMLYAPG